MLKIFYLEILKGNGHSEDLGVDGRIILKWVLYHIMIVSFGKISPSVETVVENKVEIAFLCNCRSLSKRKIRNLRIFTNTVFNASTGLVEFPLGCEENIKLNLIEIGWEIGVAIAGSGKVR
jgi:hypothetical protein